MFVHLIKVSSDMLFNKISRYLQFKISTMLTIHFAPDYISSFVSAYSCLGPSLIPGAILACVWLKSECRGGRMQKMMCCIDCEIATLILLILLPIPTQTASVIQPRTGLCSCVQTQCTDGENGSLPQVTSYQCRKQINR